MWKGNHIASAERCMNIVHSNNYAAFVLCCVSLCLNIGQLRQIPFRITSLALVIYCDCTRANVSVKQPWRITINRSLEPWSKNHTKNTINLCEYCVQAKRKYHAFFIPYFFVKPPTLACLLFTWKLFIIAPAHIPVIQHAYIVFYTITRIEYVLVFVVFSPSAYIIILSGFIIIYRLENWPTNEA